MAWAPDYVTVDELSSFLGIPEGDSVDDVRLGLAIAAASRAVDQATGRQFGLDGPTVRHYTPRREARRRRWVVDIDDLPLVGEETVVKLDLAGDGTYSTVVQDYDLRPVNAGVSGRPWTQIVVPLAAAVQPVADDEASVEILGMWGWTEVPDPVKQATLLQASRLFARKDSPYGVAGSPDMGGSEMRLLARVDPDVEVALLPYRRDRRRVVIA